MSKVMDLPDDTRETDIEISNRVFVYPIGIILTIIFILLYVCFLLAIWARELIGNGLNFILMMGGCKNE